MPVVRFYGNYRPRNPRKTIAFMYRKNIGIALSSRTARDRASMRNVSELPNRHTTEKLVSGRLDGNTI